MRIYEISVAELGTYIKIKVLDPSEVATLVTEMSDLSKDEFVKVVLENLVYNMKTEILDSLKMMSRAAAKRTVEAIYNGCVMLNPGLDIDLWVSLAYSTYVDVDANETSLVEQSMKQYEEDIKTTLALKKAKPKRLTKAKFLNLSKYLKERVIGQDEAVDVLVNALKRSQVGLNDEGRPLGVFLFAGSSGVGKTHLARELHKYLYGDEYDIVRIDCGEYQQKHDSQKITGSPPGYIGHEEGGQLANAVREHPDTVVLLDEVEKAHADIWHTFLRIFDEGILTDNKGRKVDFRNTVIIMTTNLGNDKVVESLTSSGVGFGARIGSNYATKSIPPRAQIERLATDSINKLFKPEFLNRVDDTVVFNYLDYDDYTAIADLEMQKIGDKLSKKGIVLKYNDSVLDLLVELGVNSIRGARGVATTRRDRIENPIADQLLESKMTRGTICDVVTVDKEFVVNITQPKKENEQNATPS